MMMLFQGLEKRISQHTGAQIATYANNVHNVILYTNMNMNMNMMYVCTDESALFLHWYAVHMHSIRNDME